MLATKHKPRKVKNDLITVQILLLLMYELFVLYVYAYLWDIILIVQKLMFLYSHGYLRVKYYKEVHFIVLCLDLPLKKHVSCKNLHQSSLAAHNPLSQKDHLCLSSIPKGNLQSSMIHENFLIFLTLSLLGPALRRDNQLLSYTGPRAPRGYYNC